MRNTGSSSQTYVDHFLANNFWHVMTFQTEIRHVQTFATKTCHFQTFATTMIRRDFREGSGVGATKISRPNLVCPGDGATKKQFLTTEMDTAEISRSSWRWSNQETIFRDSGGCSGTFQIMAETARL